LDHLPGVVATTIFDKEDLKAARVVCQYGGESPMKLRQDRRGSVDRDDD